MVLNQFSILSRLALHRPEHAQSIGISSVESEEGKSRKRRCPINQSLPLVPRNTQLAYSIPNIFLGNLAMAANSSSEYGKRLIPQILDNLASTEPDRIIYSIANFADGAHGFRQISARTFAKAVDKTAWWLHDQVGKPTSIQTVGYIGPRKLETKPQA